MKQSHRVALNIVATYGRSLFALVCGLFTSRWVLMSLGQVDYGLFGVVGVLTSFVGFFNGILAVSVSRFYAFSVGRANVAADPKEALEDCRKWFNTALLVHTLVPIVLMSVGYPLGLVAVERWLTIPPDRVLACRWVFLFSCISCFVAMINVPFQAMYLAKQYIAELTIYSFAQTVVTVICLYFMVSHPRDWLVGYSAIVCVVAVIPQLCICFRALKVFPECTFRKRYFFDFSRLPELFRYVGWQAFGLTGMLMKTQGIAILINKMFGAKVNAAMSVANSVNAQASTLASAMLSALSPVITQACGAGNYEQVRKYAFRASKFGVLLILVFVVPLVVELPLVLSLWLKNPPEYTTPLCIGVMLALLAEKSTCGNIIALNATGRIAAYQATVGCIVILTLPVAWLFVNMGMGVMGIVAALVLMAFAASGGRLYFSRRLLKMSESEWLLQLLLPISLAATLSIGLGLVFTHFFAPSFCRLMMTSCVCEAVFLPISWFCVLRYDERQYVHTAMQKVIRNLKAKLSR